MTEIINQSVTMVWKPEKKNVCNYTSISIVTSSAFFVHDTDKPVIDIKLINATIFWIEICFFKNNYFFLVLRYLEFNIGMFSTCSKCLGRDWTNIINRIFITYDINVIVLITTKYKLGRFEK